MVAILRDIRKYSDDNMSNWNVVALGDRRDADNIAERVHILVIIISVKLDTVFNTPNLRGSGHLYVIPVSSFGGKFGE